MIAARAIDQMKLCGSMKRPPPMLASSRGCSYQHSCPLVEIQAEARSLKEEKLTADGPHGWGLERAAADLGGGQK